MIRIITSIRRSQRQRAEKLRKEGIFRPLLDSKGYVLVMVLMVITFLVVITGRFIIVSQSGIGYITRYDRYERARYLAMSGVELGKYVLYADKLGVSSGFAAAKVSKDIDCYQDIWALQYPPVPIEEGTVTLRIVDEQSKINLSVLANEFVDETPYYGIAQRFFMGMGFRPDLADKIIDWVDIDDARYPYGAEGRDYSARQLDYDVPNAALTSISELQMIMGITQEIFYGTGGGSSGLEENLVDHNMGDVTLTADMLESFMGGDKNDEDRSEEDRNIKVGRERDRALYRYLRVHGNREDYLDEVNRINVNTAPFRVILSLSDEMTDGMVMDIIQRRQQQPYSDTADLAEYITDETVRKNLLTVRSRLYRIIATAEYDGYDCTMEAVYDRDRKQVLYFTEY